MAQTQNPTRWIIGDAKESELFDRVVTMSLVFDHSKQSALLWSGNAAVFLGAALLSTPEGASAFTSFANSTTFDLIASAGFGYCAAKTVGKLVQLAKAKRVLDFVSGAVGASPEAIAAGIERADPEPNMRRFATFASQCVEKIRARSGRAPSNKAGPR
jgi:hypothetical protein